MAHTDIYDNLLGQGLSPSIASKLDEIHQGQILAVDELDDRALEGLKEFSDEDALTVLDQFCKSDLSHVTNKSAFLCGAMKTYRAKLKLKMEEQAAASTSTSTSPTKTGTTGNENNIPQSSKKQLGLNEDTGEKVKQLLDRTGYTLDITSGQRKYGGPPPGWEGPVPGTGEKKFCSQVFIGKLPKDMYEDELVPLFEKYGQLYDLRIMVDPSTGLNKGFAFCTFVTKEGAVSAVKGMDKYEVRGNRKLGVCLSQANNRLFVGSIPKSKTKKDIFDEFSSKVEELSDVIVYISSEDKTKNRGFAFLEFSTHKDASQARRKLMSGKIKVFGHISPTVDWADPVHEPDEEVMSKVKVVYVRNLSPAIDEGKLNELFKQYGVVEKVKKLKDYAFIHFVNREDAMRAIEELDGQELDDLKIQVSLAKPQVEKPQQRRGLSGYGALNRANNEQNQRGGMRGGARGGSQYNQSYGRFNSYDDGYGDNSYGGFEDTYDNYYEQPARGRGRGGRGGNMGRGPPSNPRGAGPRGRGNTTMRGRERGAMTNRGNLNSGRGMQQRGGTTRGNFTQGGFRGANNRGMPPKRKADFGGYDNYSSPQKRKPTNEWNSKPIAQQPLRKNSDYYSDDYTGQDWYTDLSKRWQ